MTMLRVVPANLHSTRRRRASEIVSLFGAQAAPAMPERLSLEDRIEVDELISEYAAVVDHGRWNELRAEFVRVGAAWRFNRHAIVHIADA
jgi:hypothetical protein